MSRWNESVRIWPTLINSIPMNGSAAIDSIDRAVSISSFCGINDMIVSIAFHRIKAKDFKRFLSKISSLNYQPH
jgi:hypothetical protein